MKKSLRALKNQLPHIRRLRFAQYRSIKRDEELQLGFPVTVLLGKNGTNKSSILHALAGSPLRRTISEYWFETKLDAIPETTDGRKQSVVHAFFRDECEVECIKARAPRDIRDPDYWEPIKPSGAYGFPPNAQRETPIELEVLYLDFRAELPAFDKYLYFPDPAHLKKLQRYDRKESLRRMYRPQDYLRSRAGFIRKKLEDPDSEMGEEALSCLRYILGRDYGEGWIVHHDILHGHAGYTIRFRTPALVDGYSDAFAGSGESAAAILVHRILQAKERTLVLLDEPETSLHPQAQQRLLEFLCHYAARKHLQIVIATHSQYLSEPLPQSAIRTLLTDKSGQVLIRDDYTPKEALNEIGHLPRGKTVFVEDARARDTLEAAFRKYARQALEEVHVIVRPGGASGMWRAIQAYADGVNWDVWVLFDGDQRFSSDVPAPKYIPRDLLEMTKLAQELTKGRDEKGPRLPFASEECGLRYFDFLRERTLFLPADIPEDLVWSTEAAAALLDGELPQTVADAQDTKAKIAAVADAHISLRPDDVFRTLLGHFFGRESEAADELRRLVDRIRGVPVP